MEVNFVSEYCPTLVTDDKGRIDFLASFQQMFPQSTSSKGVDLKAFEHVAEMFHKLATRFTANAKLTGVKESTCVVRVMQVSTDKLSLSLWFSTIDNGIAQELNLCRNFVQVDPFFLLTLQESKAPRMTTWRFSGYVDGTITAQHFIERLDARIAFDPFALAFLKAHPVLKKEDLAIFKAANFSEVLEAALTTIANSFPEDVYRNLSEDDSILVKLWLSDKADRMLVSVVKDNCDPCSYPITLAEVVFTPTTAEEPRFVPVV